MKQEEWIALLQSDIDAFNLAIASVPVTERTMFRYADLDGLHLTHAHLHYCDLTGASLNEAHVSGHALSRCRLYQTILTGTILDDPYWLPAIQQIQILWRSADEWNDFRSKNQPAILESTCFRQADLGNADLSGMIFSSADFSGADLSKCKLEATNFLGASLMEVNLSGNKLDHTNFSEAKMEYARLNETEFRFVNLVKADLSGASLQEVSFERTDAHELKAVNSHWKDMKASRSLFFKADLSNCRFTNAHFTHCNFNQVVFNQSVFTDASLIQCAMADIKTEGAVFINTQREDAAF